MTCTWPGSHTSLHVEIAWTLACVVGEMQGCCQFISIESTATAVRTEGLRPCWWLVSRGANESRGHGGSPAGVVRCRRGWCLAMKALPACLASRSVRMWKGFLGKNSSRIAWSWWSRSIFWKSWSGDPKWSWTLSDHSLSHYSSVPAVEGALLF